MEDNEYYSSTKNNILMVLKLLILIKHLQVFDLAFKYIVDIINFINIVAFVINIVVNTLIN